MPNNENCYEKTKKAALMAFIVLLGGGTILVELSILTQNVYFWSFGLVLAMTSGIFVTMGLVAKSKLKELRN